MTCGDLNRAEYSLHKRKQSQHRNGHVALPGERREQRRVKKQNRLNGDEELFTADAIRQRPRERRGEQKRNQREKTDRTGRGR
jgi:hypothetical protein